MSSLAPTLFAKHGIIPLDEATIDAFLAVAPGEAAHRMLFFAGDPSQRSETQDVAVILPQLLKAFSGRLRAGVIVREAEEALKRRFHVCVFPSLVITRGDETLGVLPKVYDWSDYVCRIEAMLALDAPALAASNGPRTTFVFTRREAV